MNGAGSQFSPDPDGIDLRWVVTVVERRVLLIAICVLVALAGVFAFVSLRAPSYAATATMLVEPVQDANNNEYNILVAGEQLAITYAQMLKSNTVLEELRARLAIDEPLDQLADRLTVVAVQNTQLVRLTAQATTPQEAQRTANTAAEVFTAYIHSLHSARYQAPLDALQQQIDAANGAIDRSQARIDTLNENKVAQEAERTRLETLLTDLRSDNRALQDNLLSVQLQIDQLSGSVYVIQPADAPAGNAEAILPAEVVLLIGQAPDAQSTEYASSFASGMILQTYQKMLTAQPVLEAALAQAEVDQNAAWLASRVVVAPGDNTQLLRLTVQGLPGATAAALANAIAAAFISQNQAMLAEPFTNRIAELQGEIDGLTARIDETQASIKGLTEGVVQADIELAQLDTRLTEERANLRTVQQDYEALNAAAAGSANVVVITESATAPTRPTQTKIPFIILGGIAGLLFGMGIAFVLEQLSDKIRSPQDVQHALGLKPIGSVSLLSPSEPEMVVNAPPSVQAEEFRLLTISIRLTHLGQPLRTLLVTSPNAAEGKSLVAANLAATYARSGSQVVLIDADLRYPRIHQFFGLQPDRGLTDLLPDGNVEAYLKPTSVEGLRVLTSGIVPLEMVDVFSSPRLRGLIDELTEIADLVVIDSAPVLAVADTSILAAMMDGALLVLRSGKSGREAAREAVERLHITKTNLLGVVLNAAPEQNAGYYRYTKPSRRKYRLTLRPIKNVSQDSTLSREG
ncbi:MAG TPA: polysaccharide biosynthesis tyrosine autokinase [Anaerolineaceae bacterium]|nr:polysaccharide biosynthesis tyrosine autokinase [Anaerolineaceae bacterium]